MFRPWRRHRRNTTVPAERRGEIGVPLRRSSRRLAAQRVHVRDKFPFLTRRSWDVLAVQEISRQTFDQWCRAGLGDSAVGWSQIVEVSDMKRPHGCALFARAPFRLESAVPLPTESPVAVAGPADALPRPERGIAAQLTGFSLPLTVASWHTPHAAGSGDERRWHRTRKERSYAAVSKWLGEQRPVILGLDSNTWTDPVDLRPPDPDLTEEDQPHCEAFHLADPAHGCKDAYRAFLAGTPGGVAELERLRATRPEGPLAVTYDTGDRRVRMDRVYLSEEFSVLAAGHEYEPAIVAGSDHGYMWAEIALRGVG